MNRNRHIGAQIKKDETYRVRMACRELPPITRYPVSLHITWYRRNKRTDPDNIAFSTKFLLDGMQQAGVLQQDTWASIASIKHDFRVDADNPGVEIVIDGE